MNNRDRPWAKNSTYGPRDSALPEHWTVPLQGQFKYALQFITMVALQDIFLEKDI